MKTSDIISALFVVCVMLLMGFGIGISMNRPSETCQVTYNEKTYDVPCEVLNDR
jgi:hypothetical protein